MGCPVHSARGLFEIVDAADVEAVKKLKTKATECVDTIIEEKDKLHEEFKEGVYSAVFKYVDGPIEKENADKIKTKKEVKVVIRTSSNLSGYGGSPEKDGIKVKHCLKVIQDTETLDIED